MQTCSKRLIKKAVAAKNPSRRQRARLGLLQRTHILVPGNIACVMYLQVPLSTMRTIKLGVFVGKPDGTFDWVRESVYTQLRNQGLSWALAEVLQVHYMRMQIQPPARVARYVADRFRRVLALPYAECEAFIAGEGPTTFPGAD